MYSIIEENIRKGFPNLEAVISVSVFSLNGFFVVVQDHYFSQFLNIFSLDSAVTN